MHIILAGESPNFYYKNNSPKIVANPVALIISPKVKPQNSNGEFCNDLNPKNEDFNNFNLHTNEVLKKLTSKVDAILLIRKCLKLKFNK